MVFWGRKNNSNFKLETERSLATWGNFYTYLGCKKALWYVKKHIRSGATFYVQFQKRSTYVQRTFIERSNYVQITFKECKKNVKITFFFGPPKYHIITYF